MQIQHRIHPQTNQIWHVIHACKAAVRSGNGILDLFLIGFEILQQIIILRVQISADTFSISVNCKFRTDCNVFLRSQTPLLYIQIQFSVSQHVQPLCRMNAHNIDCQILDRKTTFLISFLLLLCPDLKFLYNSSELFLTEQIIFPAEAVAIQIANQRKILPIRCRIHPTAIFQITEHFQICHLIKQRFILMRIIMNIPHKPLIHRTIRSFNYLGRQNRIHVNGIILLQRIFAQMKSLHAQTSPGNIQITNSNPISGNLILFIPIFNCEPASFMDRPKNISINRIHISYATPPQSPRREPEALLHPQSAGMRQSQSLLPEARSR